MNTETSFRVWVRGPHTNCWLFYAELQRLSDALDYGKMVMDMNPDVCIKILYPENWKDVLADKLAEVLK